MFDLAATRPSPDALRPPRVNSYYRNTPYWARRKENATKGLCFCGQERKPGIKVCVECNEKRLGYCRNARLKRRGKICFLCRAPLAAQSRSRCVRCLEKAKAAYWASPAERIRKVRMYAKALRLDALRAYGMKCACCGETCETFLCFDHIHNDGKEHRKAIGPGTTRLLRWLRKNNYPDTIQILCFNCNMGKELNGICPHKKAKRAVAV